MSQKMIKNLKRNENSAGGVVFYLDNDSLPHILLIMDKFKKWSLPKGHIEQSETAEVAARREIFEETGIQELEIIEQLGSVEYEFTVPSSDQNVEINKKVEFFLFSVNLSSISALRPNLNEIVEMEWFSPETAIERAGYANIKFILEKAIKIIESKKWK